MSVVTRRRSSSESSDLSFGRNPVPRREIGGKSQYLLINDGQEMPCDTSVISSGEGEGTGLLIQFGTEEPFGSIVEPRGRE